MDLCNSRHRYYKIRSQHKQGSEHCLMNIVYPCPRIHIWMIGRKHKRPGAYHTEEVVLQQSGYLLMEFLLSSINAKKGTGTNS